MFVMRYNKNPGEKRKKQKMGRHECHKHLHVRIFQRLNFGGSFSSCSEIPPFCKPVGRFAVSGAGAFWIVETIGDARSYV